MLTNTVPHWHTFLSYLRNLRSTLESSVISDRKEIGHSCSTVPLKSRWCAFHIVSRYSSRSSQIRTHRTLHASLLGENMYNSLVHQLAHHAEHEDGSARVHHSDVGDQSGFVARAARSTSHDPNIAFQKSGTHLMSIAHSDDEYLMGFEISDL